MDTNSRRQFLKLSAGATGIGILATPMAKALAASCGLTPPQTSGPFYPGEDNMTSSNDLTIVPGRQRAASGQVILIRGQVLDDACNPIEGANVEIWQACASGRYNHKNDPNPAPLDPDFKYWGETYTDSSGTYVFKTVKPGAYPADKDWDRPPHIHFKISRRGYHDLITQMYFQGEALNSGDLILRDLSAQDQSRVIVPFSPDPKSPHILNGEFNITLKSVR